MDLHPTRWPLRYRILAATMLVEVVMLSALLWNNARVTERYLLEQAEHRVRSIQPLLNASLARPLFEEDVARLREIIDEFVHTSGIDFLRLYNGLGESLVSAGVAVPKLNYVSSGDLAEHIAMSRADGLFPLRMPVTLEGRQVGSVELTMNIGFIEQALHESAQQGLVIATLAVVSSAVLLALVAGVLTRQLNVLTKAAKTMADGDLAVRVPVREYDEVGRTAAMFNHLAERMASAQAALTESESRIRLLLNSTAEAIYGIDLDGICIFANPACAQMLGYPDTQSLVGKPLHPLNRDITQNASNGAPGCPILLAVRDNRSRHDDREVFWRRDGSRFPVDYHCTPIANGGRLVGGVVAFRDITERQRVESLKNEFVSTVSHELRTPLTSINGTLSLLSGGVAGPLSESAQAMLQIAARNGQRLLRLINDILDIEKIESGKMDFYLKEQPLMPLVDEAIQATQSYAQQHNTRLLLRQSLPQVMVNVDGHRLVQIISNLVANAAKFTRPGTQIEVRVIASAPGRVRVAVTDHGDGIAEEFRARIFQKFSQADASDTRQKGGTGLGLCICKALVERMAGTIGYETHIGVGTTFFFDLPRRSITADTTGAENNAPDAHPPRNAYHDS
jgi:PAS domain S-box-containing protein